MYNAQEEELKILAYWDEKKCFEKSVEERPTSKPYVFYDGPPFATGLPHYGHIVASLMKDVVPRFWTMRGFRVERKWGWDCHGLPIENLVEKDLNLASKKDIEDYGVGKFNEDCRAKVLKYADEWKKTVRRMGRWVDMENDYKTMDVSYMESVWWVFKELYKKDLLYKGHKAMHICPRCVTPLSNFEVTQGYKDVKDISVYAKFKVTNAKEKLGVDEDVFVLAWTTTPWTLPGNVLLAVGKEIEYVVVKTIDTQKRSQDGLIEYQNLILAKNIFLDLLKRDSKDALKLAFNLVYGNKIKEGEESVQMATSIKEFKGSDLFGLTYEPLFPYFKDIPNAFRVVEGDFVTTESGTGVVHIAPAFGEDDYKVGQRENVPLVQHVKMDGRFVEEVEDFAGHEVKPANEPTVTDIEIIKWLAAAGKLFAKEKFEHSYPHCWRCDAPLLNYATNSWYVKVTAVKEQLLKNNETINWVPEHIKYGRFGLWLEGARDWAISRNRFWGTPLPVWESEDGEVICVGGVKELEELCGQKVTDLHKHKIDDLEITQNNKVFKRIPEVLDCWFESGSMPYGQMHYPFENKEKFESGFPAEFIAEGQDQTRGWFYTLHILATALTMGDKPTIPKEKSVPAFKNVIVNGIVLAEDGKKMSKRLKNYPEPDLILEKYGADAMRYYLITSPVMEAESLNFSEVGVREMYNKVVNTLSNVMEFYRMYADQATNNSPSTANVLDQWIMAKMQQLIKDVTLGMETYKLVNASRPIMDFINDLSTWYLRRSRDRFKGDDEADKQAALATLKHVLLTLAKVMAPFTPFIAEKIYLEFGGELESVHLEMWPEVDRCLENNEVLVQMEVAKKIVELGLAARAEKGLKVRQPLNELKINNSGINEELRKIIADELNVKEINFAKEILESQNLFVKTDGLNIVGLNIEITEELKKEGLLRDVVRSINALRKEKGLTINDKIRIIYQTEDENLMSVFTDFNEQLKSQVLAGSIESGNASEGTEIEVGEMKVRVVIS